jgi:peptide deformylase
MNLPIVQAGDEVLRMPARSLSRADILGDDIQKLIADMRDTMRSAPGVGLAAPQVGVSVQLAVIEDRAEYHAKASREQLEERQRRPVPFHVIVNPRIVSSDGPPLEFFEGCLSVNGYVALVPRSRHVTVEFLNERAEPVRVNAEGWYARILQHEIDHLQGCLYIDRMHSRSFCTTDNFERLWKGSPIQVVRRTFAVGPG